MLSRLDLPPRAVLAIDGHGASGKTTLARRLAAEHGAACVVGTDDLAWHHSFFDWADLLIDEGTGRGNARTSSWGDHSSGSWR